MSSGQVCSKQGALVTLESWEQATHHEDLNFTPLLLFPFSFKCGEFNGDEKSAALASTAQLSPVAVGSIACTARRFPSTCVTRCSAFPSRGSDQPTLCYRPLTTNGAKICGCYINKGGFSLETKIRPPDPFFTCDRQDL